MRLLLCVFPIVAALGARTADACSPPECQAEPSFSPFDTATLPANAPGLFIGPSFNYIFASSEIDAGITLASVGSGDLPIAVTKTGSGFEVIPQAPLVAGRTYILTSRTLCSTWNDEDADLDYHSSFDVIAEQPLPQTSGELRLDGVSTREHVVPYSGASCAETHRTAAFADFTMTLAPEVTPFLPITRIGLEVDGTARQWSDYGAASATTKLSAHGVCDRSSSYPDTGLELGKHTAALVASMPGGEVLRSTPVDFELQCDPSCGCNSAGTPALLSLGVSGWLLRRRARKARTH